MLVYLGLAIALSFLCSIAESVLLSITPSFIAGLQAERPRLAATLRTLRHDRIDQSLAAILTLNTIAHTAVRSVPAPRPPAPSAVPGWARFRWWPRC